MWLLLAACSGSGPAPDADGDGFDRSVDCDDGDPFVHPGANEFCDGRDDDCDGVVDSPSPLGTTTWYTDADGDAFGDPAGDTLEGCDPGEGWAREPTDCDDADPTLHPRQYDRCNGIDDDCNGSVDDSPDIEWFVDADDDGHGDPDQPRRSCAGTAKFGDDCDDTNPLTYAGAPETCDGEDNDCDGRPDSFEATVDPPTWYADLDQDGYGIAEFPLVQCVPPNPSWAIELGDCNDFDAASNPGALQLCTLADTNCDGVPGDASTGWWNEAWPVRIPLTVTAEAPSEGALVTAVVDFRAALDAVQISDPLDPSSVVVVVQDCSVEPVALPTSFVDALGDPFGPGEVADPPGDERGLVTFRLDRPLARGQVLDLAVYVGGPPVVREGGVIATATTLDTPSFSATFDPDRAGALDALTIGGVRGFSQADAREGNGVLGDGGWTQLGPTAPILVANDPLFAAISTDGVYEGPAGPVRYALWWFGWDGSPALYTRIVVEAAGPVIADEVRPFELVPLDLVGPIPDGGPGWASLSDGTTGLLLGWVTPPADLVSTTCDTDGCRVVANEGQLGSVGAGDRLIDHRVLALVPFVGPVGADPIEAVQPSTSVSVGGAQLP